MQRGSTEARMVVCGLYGTSVAQLIALSRGQIQTMSLPDIVMPRVPVDMEKRQKLCDFHADSEFEQFLRDTLVYCFLNSLTALGAELEGRHYGGGVLELVPSEIERLLVPVPPNIRPELRTLDALVRQTNAYQVLEVQDQQLLQVLRFDDAEISTLREAWTRLKNRRQRSTSETSLDLDDEGADPVLIAK